MEFFRIKKDIPFMRYAFVFNLISFATFLAAVFFLINKGLNLSVEFTGGVVVEAHYSKPASLEPIREQLHHLGIQEPQVQHFGSQNDVLIRLAVSDLKHVSVIHSTNNPAINHKPILDKSLFTDTVLKHGGDNGEITRVEDVGAQVGQELAIDGVTALLVVISGIVLYLALRFEWKFAVAAIIANLHDVVIILGFFAAFQWEFSLAVLAAILAVLGYSVNESVVIADRIRENFRSMRHATVNQVIDNAITSTISRTIITHGLTETMVLSMLMFGGPTLHYFAVALTIGILFGIYSSVLVMAPLTRWLGIKREDLIKPIKPKHKQHYQDGEELESLNNADSGYEQGEFVGDLNDFDDLQTPAILTDNSNIIINDNNNNNQITPNANPKAKPK